MQSEDMAFSVVGQSDPQRIRLSVVLCFAQRLVPSDLLKSEMDPMGFQATKLTG